MAQWEWLNGNGIWDWMDGWMDDLIPTYAMNRYTVLFLIGYIQQT